MKRLWKLPSFKSSKRLIFLYGSIILGFIIWMVFIDTHSWIIHSELNKEIDELEEEKKALREIIKNDKKIIKQLNNIDSLERFAREQYGYKKLNETIFIIENSDSLNKK